MACWSTSFLVEHSLASWGFVGQQFPLLSKSEYLNKTLKKRETSLQNKAGVLNNDSEDEEDSLVILRLCEFPGSVESFEMCAKFCYGITFTLNASNVSAVRCAAEYLEMTEAIEKSNLIFKLEVFFNSSILRGWKDSILCLQQSKSFIPWAEHLKVLTLILFFSPFPPPVSKPTPRLSSSRLSSLICVWFRCCT